MKRFDRLEIARSLDWRFLLPSPSLGRVALYGVSDAGLDQAVASTASAVARDAEAVTSAGTWDVAVVDVMHTRAASLDRTFELIRPGGWLLLNLPPRARVRGVMTSVERALSRLGAESITRHWYVPDRRSATRIVTLDDRNAVSAMLARHGRRTLRRTAVTALATLARTGLPPDLLGGDVSLMARRRGGEPLSGWPSLEALAPMLHQQLGLTRPSWILLTPRFPASAHVVMLLLADDRVHAVAKVARLAGDDGPRREAAVLESVGRRMPSGSAPRLVTSTEVSGHAVLVEEAMDGTPLDRRLARSDPARWIRAASAWLALLPTDTPTSPANVEEGLRRPLERVGEALTTVEGGPSLIARTRRVLAALEEHSLPAAFEHGDFGHPNLLIREDGRLGVLDWELASTTGLPVQDLTFFLGYLGVAIASDETEPFASFERVLAEPAWGAAAALRGEATRVKVDPDALPGLIVACWVRAFARHDRQAVEAGSAATSRYYRLWEGAVEQQERLKSLLA